MRKILLSTFLFGICTFLFSISAVAGNYTWTGNTNTNWATVTNWSPNGIPGSADNVTIVSGTNQPVIGVSRTVTNFTMSSGTLGFSSGQGLTVLGSTSITGGTINANTSVITFSGAVSFTGGTYNTDAAQSSLLIGSSSTPVSSVILGTTSSGPTIGRATIYTNSLQMMNTTFGNSSAMSLIKVTNSTANITNIGANQFYKVTIEAAGTSDLALSSYAASTYVKVAIFNNSGSGKLYTAYSAADTYVAAALSEDSLAFQNTGSGYIYANYKGTHTIDRNISLTSTGSSQGIFFGNSTGITNLWTARTLRINSFTTGTLELKKVIQPTGVATSQTINLSGNAVLRYTSSIFNGNIVSSSPGIEFNTATFNGTTILTKTGSGLSSSISSSGYTYFNGPTTITNAGSGELQLGGSSFFGFSFKGDATFNKTGTGALNAAYSGYVYFYGNLTVLNNSFGTGTAFVGFPGAVDQYVSGTITAYNLLVQKYSSDVIVTNTTELITVTNTLFFSGFKSRLKILAAPVVMANNAVVTGASSNNYVTGFFQKVGNQSFTFPLGSPTSYTYMPISITAPASATDVFTAVYNDESSTSTAPLASPLKSVTPGCWTIFRTVGSSTIQVTLSWNSNTPKPIFPDAARVAVLNSTWQDGGANNLSYGYLQGSVTSNALTSSATTLRLAFTSANPDACSTSDATMNWVSVRSFDEYGRVINDQRVFADNFGRAKQTQQRNLVENAILAKSTVYDTYGRAGLATLPAPIADVTCFAYNANFMTNSSGAAYSRKDFDSTNAGSSVTLNAPNLVSSTSPLGKYYSNSNTYEAYVATSSYPYKTIDYNDFVIEGVTRSSDVADDLRMGNGHEQRSITLPVFGELNNYYAVKNGNFVASGGTSLDGEVLKTVTKDENGTEQITYTNKSGQTIAQCVASTTESQNISVNIYAQASVCNFDVPSAYTYKNVQIHGAGPLQIYDNNLGTTWTGTAATQPFKIMESSYQIKSNSPFYLTYDIYFYDTGGSTTFYTKGRAESTNTNLLQNSTDVHLQANHQLSFTNSSANGNIKVMNLETGVTLYVGPASSFTLAPYLAPGFYRIQYTTQVGAYVNASGAYITISYVNRYGNYTYSFYDNVGRVIAQTAPNGVNRSTNNYPKFTSFYIYNTLGWLLFSSDPDRGASYYVYQKDGKLRFSQDAVQRAANRFSYINYDNIKRITETGEYTSGAAFGSPTALYFKNMLSNYVGETLPSGYTSIYTVLENTDGIDDARCSTVSKESYDKPVTLPSGLSTYTQRNVNGNVSTSSNNNLTSWYSYDELGRLEWSIQQFAGTTAGTAGGDFSAVAANRIKTIDYQYDLLGNLLQVNYQKNTSAERLDHYYTYDVMRRLKKVETSLSGGALMEQAEYQYYLHGPLKRKELGNDLQGLDYVYTIDGKLKAINHPYLDANDPGADSYTGTHSAFSKDVFGMMLEYYDNDYVRDSKFQTTSNLTASGYTNYYNGIIRSATWQQSGSSLSQYGYTYDAKYQLMGATFGAHSTSTNQFTASSTNQYKVYGITYDLNGNLQTLRRNDATGATASKDYINYIYTAYTNKLQKTQNSTPVDTRTYTYDVNGRMTSYSNVTTSTNQYTLYDYSGKVTAVYKDASYTQPLVSFLYDEKGNQIRKTQYNASSPYAAASHTWYINDAAGNVLSTYVTTVSTTTTVQDEIFIYAANRIGKVDKSGTVEYNYEIKDQVGNTRAVIRRNTTTLAAEVLDWRDYDPHGNLIQGSIGSDNNRYACYQGEYAERNDETGFVNFDLRMYDPAIGRWMIPDPMHQNYSPYLAMGNNPLINTDPTGGEYTPYGYYGGYGGGYGGGYSQSGGNVAYFYAGGGGYSYYSYSSGSSFSMRSGGKGQYQGGNSGRFSNSNFNGYRYYNSNNGSGTLINYGSPSASAAFAASGYFTGGRSYTQLKLKQNQYFGGVRWSNNSGHGKPSTKSIFDAPAKAKGPVSSNFPISSLDPISILIKKLSNLENYMNGSAPANNKTVETSFGSDKIYNENSKNTDEPALRSTSSEATGVIIITNDIGKVGVSSSGLLAAPGGAAETFKDVAGDVNEVIDYVSSEKSGEVKNKKQNAGEGDIRFDPPPGWKP